MPRIRYNAPVILTFALVSLVVLGLDALTGRAIGPRFFAAPPDLALANPLIYLRLVTHIAGHQGWAHLAGNFTIILLVGPILEERHGSRALLAMIVITAVVTGIVNALLSDSWVMGASGIAFMLIVLASRTGSGVGIPLTFILVAVMFLGPELVGAFREDRISQLAHFVGGACGAVFGFASAPAARTLATPRLD
jgi:membrane associated rhomboid family serine protease